MEEEKQKNFLERNHQGDLSPYLHLKFESDHLLQLLLSAGNTSHLNCPQRLRQERTEDCAN